MGKRFFKSSYVFHSFIVAFILIIVLIPILWTFLSSLKQRVDVFSEIPIILFKPTFNNYGNLIFGDHPVYPYFINSFIVTGGVVLLGSTVGLMTSYGLARFRIKIEKHVLFFFLSLRMAPPIAVALPLFMMFSQLRLIDTYIGVIFAHSTFIFPFVVWMMTSYIREIPYDLEEAALIDGCSRFVAFRKIILPLTIPGLATTILFAVLLSWTEFLFSLVITGSNTKTVTVAITESWGGIVVDWGMLTSFSIIAMAPVIIIAFVLQRHLIRGLTFGALK